MRSGSKEISKFEMKNISGAAKLIDHTLLKPGAGRAELRKLCREARRYGFHSVCVNPANVKYSAGLLKGSGVKICSVAGFPLGASTADAKAFEAGEAVSNGADEIDMVVNIGALKSGNYELVLDEIRKVRSSVGGKTLKVIIEASLLSRKEKVKACLAAKSAGADFVKTSTGFSGGGAKASDVRLMRETVGSSMGVKPPEAWKSLSNILSMVKAGASRIGTSNSVVIAREACRGRENERK